MVKKMMNTGFAILTVAGMFVMTAFAIEGDTRNENGLSTEIESPVYINEPVIEVELPGDLGFGINPFRLDADEDGIADAQIISKEYLIKNNSNVPVLIGTSTKLSAAEESNVEIVTTPRPDPKTEELSSNEGKKAIWMVQLLPTMAADLSADEGNILTVTAPTSITDTSLKGKVIGEENSPAEALFKLEANTGDTMSPACVSGFKFAGAVDPTKTFTEEDGIQVTTVFTMNILSANQIASYQQVTGYNETIVEAK